MAEKIKISGVIITYNEERNIEECILSMQSVVDEIVVIDSFSNDATPEICNQLGVKFIQNSFDGHIEQKNFAMKQATFDYILSLDADERLSLEMLESIVKIKADWTHAGYEFNRLNNYCGAWLKHSWYPDRKLRLWDRRKGKWGGTNPHDKVILDDNLKAKRIKVSIVHFAYANLDEHYEQVKKFAIIASNERFKQGKRANFLIHLIINPWYTFIRTYILRLGILDGYYGFIYSSMVAYLSFLKYSRLWELNRNNKFK